MNRSKLLVTAVICLVLINLGTLAFMLFSPRGRQGFEQRPPRGDGPRLIIIERLGFDAAQQQVYEIIIKEHRSKTNALHEASARLHNELYALLKDPAGSADKSETIIGLIAENQRAVDHLNFDHFEKIRAICKGDQLQKFNQLAGDLAALFSHQGPPQ